MGSRKKAYHSIKKTLTMTNIMVIAVVLVTFIISTLYYNSVVLQYQKLIENVNRANALSSFVKTDMDNTAYNLVAGKTTPDDSAYITLFSEISQQLDVLEAHSSSPQNANLIEVARRTLGTAEGYIDQIIQNINNAAPVRDSELILDDIHQVSELLNDIILDFTASEIELSEEKNASLQEVNIIMNMIQMGVFAAAILFLIMNNRTLQRHISKPLRRMQDMAGLIAHGDFDVRIEQPEIVELDELTDSMNQMAGKIDSLMRANTEKQKTLRKAELQILQAQISPHFLYNTLDTIVALAETGQLEEVVTTTIALSSFHRISRSKGNDWIPVSQEVTQIESYMTIQKMRYGMLLEYTIDVDEDIMQESMLKILLQPLVENAIYHGIKNSRKGGTIRITGHREGNDLVFCVKNSGPGMDAKTLDSLRASLEHEYDNPTNLDKPGYGLYNVYRRIMLFYDVSNGLEIVSDAEAGTTITLRLPILKAGE